MPNAASTRRIALLLALALCLPLAARADEASHRAKAQEMMSLLHTDKLVQQVADSLMKQITQAADKASGPDATPDAKAKIADFEKQCSQMIEAQVSWKAMQEQFTDIYAKHLTEEQLDAIIAFYKSPAGSALVASMPDVNAEVGQVGQSRVQALQPQLQQLYVELRKSLPPPAPTLGPMGPAPASPSGTPAAPATPPASTPK